MSIYEILPAFDLTQSVHAKISIGMHRGSKFKISRIPLIGLETRLGWRTDRKFLRNPNLNEIEVHVDTFYANWSNGWINHFNLFNYDESLCTHLQPWHCFQRMCHDEFMWCGGKIKTRKTRFLTIFCFFVFCLTT